ncbi:MAG: site-specific DNA-methyltransferase [Dethiobacteria bacterium]|jgi:adenine-specific DNA-methyltransferase
MKFLETLEQTLKQDNRFVGEDGRLLKAKVYDACMGMDGSLLETLMNNETLKSHFFVEVNGTLIFDKTKFAWVLESREFLPDSYTMFKNKIGLTNSKGNLISRQNDVTLVWPYKDCVLEGGQTKEDQKRDEVFYNETLAPDEVNRLLYPKVFTNAKRYSVNGAEEIAKIEDKDNLIIRGNNLLALASLQKRYKGQIKCVFIDPPSIFFDFLLIAC